MHVHAVSDRALPLFRKKWYPWRGQAHAGLYSFISMVITWYGQSCFKLQTGDLVGVIDPFSKDIGLTPPRFRADFVLVTHDHFDHNNTESIPENPFIIRGPGEYEIKGVSMRGIQAFHEDVLENIGDVDILMIPVGGTYTIDEEEAAKIVNQIEPRVVIPMHYKVPGLKVNIESVEKFLKEMGVRLQEAEERYTIKQKDLPQDDRKVVVLRAP